ncbi:homeobox protein Hox-B9 isoform X3 [Alligator sinensis]|uniref:Homeobox protein Hox-B9 isoform X3 n=1 Tax=Alligator sinensis TaxID=38654 RepID=A0A3Q0GMZ2_ALLSI|nr:homeobox protein Hox-B9 isoform X3 [Alligator sinensis]
MSRHQPGLRFLPPHFHPGWGDPPGPLGPQKIHPCLYAPRGKDEACYLGFDAEKYPPPQAEVPFFSKLEPGSGSSSPGSGPGHRFGASLPPYLSIRPSGSQPAPLPTAFTPSAVQGHPREGNSPGSCSDTEKGDYEVSLILKPAYGSETPSREDQSFFPQEAPSLDRSKDDKTAQEIQDNDFGGGRIHSLLRVIFPLLRICSPARRFQSVIIVRRKPYSRRLPPRKPNSN